jgi:pantothenate kinase type III
MQQEIQPISAPEVENEVPPSIIGPSNSTSLDAKDAMQSGCFQSMVLQVHDLNAAVAC